MKQDEVPVDEHVAGSAGERKLVVLKQTILAAVLVILPLFYTRIPPLEDYPNHLARMFVLAQPENPFLSRFYEVNWAPIPNLIMDLFVPPLVPLFGVYTAGRIFIGATLLLMMLGPMTLHRALYGRWSAFPLVGGLFVYNGFLFVGLMNYMFGVGVAVFGLALWVALSNIHPLWRATCSLAVCAVLYVSHLSALGLYAIAISGFEAWRVWENRPARPGRILAAVCAVGVPFLPFAWLLTHSPTWGLSREIDWQPQGKLEAVSRFLSVYSDFIDLPFLILLVAAVIIAVRRGLVRMHPAGWVVAAGLTLAFIAMPRVAFGSFMADERLVVGIFFLTLGFVATDLRKLEGQNAFIAICLVTIAIRVVDISVNWANLSQPVLDLKDALRTMEPGSRLLVTQAEDSIDGAVGGALAHAPNLAVIERSALVSRLFLVKGKQIVHARPGYSEQVDTVDGDTPSISQILIDARRQRSPDDEPRYWDNWPKRFDYLVTIGSSIDAPTDIDPEHLKVVRAGHGFVLYRVLKRL